MLKWTNFKVYQNAWVGLYNILLYDFHKLCKIQVKKKNYLFFSLISNFRVFLNVVCFLLGNYPASEFYMPTFRNTLSFCTYPPMKTEQTFCSETSAYKIQTPGNYPEESIKLNLFFCFRMWFFSVFPWFTAVYYRYILTKEKHTYVCLISK